MYPKLILTSVRLHLALCLFTVSAALPAQSSNHNLILLDPAHGGSDLGATFNGTAEKDLTLALAANLRALLAARNFTVAFTRDTDVALASDQRAATANHLHPAACLLLHATASGNGIHVITSSLIPSDTLATPIPWDTAQSAHLSQSRSLANTLGFAILHAKLPVTLTPAALRPLDNLTCPAVAIEIAPLANGAHPTPPTDSAYQRRVAEAIAYALTDWLSKQPSGSASSGVTP